MGIKSKIASLVVDMTANSASYNNELKKSKKNTQTWAQDVKKHAKIGGAAVAAAGLVAAYGLVKLTTEAMTNADALAKHADKLGVTTEALGGLRHQAELNGVAQRALDVGLQRMVRRVSEAAQGTGVAASALKELNINALELNRLSPDQQFAKIADAMAGINAQSDKVRLGFKLFDSEGVGLINAMREGAAGIAGARKEADLLGVTISRIDAAKIEAANDATYRSDQVWKGLGNTLAISVSPFITEMKTEFVGASKASNGFRDEVATGMKVIAKGVGYAGNTIRGLEVIFKSVQYVATVMTTGVISLLDNISTGYMELYNLIVPKSMEVNTEKTLLSVIAAEGVSAIGRLKAELHGLMMEKLPTEKVDEYFAKIQSKAQAAAEKVAAAVDATRSNKSSIDPDTSSESDVDKIASELNKGTELYSEAYARRQTIIENAWNTKQITDERYLEISKSNWANHQEEIVKIEASRRKEMVNGSKGMFANLATLASSGSKKIAAIGKMAARINIGITTAEAAMNGYNWGMKFGGPYLAAASAAAAVAAGLMRLRQLDSGGISGGSSGGLSGGTTFDQSLPNKAVSTPVDSTTRGAREVIIHQTIEIKALDGASVEEVVKNNPETFLQPVFDHIEETGGLAA